MEVLKDVLIKEVDGRKDGDKVFIINNLPKNLIYTKVRKMVIDRSNPQQNLVPEYKVENGIRVETGAMVDELLPGIEHSMTGDGSYVFFVSLNEAKMRLQDIDRYLQATIPVSERVARRIPYSSQPGVMTASPRPLSQIPRVELPEPVSPPVNSVQVEAPSSVIQAPAAPKKVRKPLTEAQKAAARQRMAVARAAKKAAEAQQ